MTQHPRLRRDVTFGDLVVDALERFPERVAFRQGKTEWTYRHTAGLLARWVSVLRQRGLRAGDGVGVLSPNRPEVWLGQTSPALAGGRYTALHPLGSLDDHLYACTEAELRFLIVDPAFAHRAGELEARCDAIEQVFTLGPAEVGEDLNALVERAPSARLEAGPHGPDDLSWLLYTGGTTGVPKAAMLPDRAVVQMVQSVSLGWDLPRPMRYLACAPITHAAGCLIVPALLSGGTITLQRGFDPEAWLRAIPEVNANLGLLVPTMIYAVLDHPALRGPDLSSLETVMYGASPMSPTRMAEALERIGQVFCQLYAQTESGAVGTSLWRADHDKSDLARLATCGKPMPGVRVAILDDDANPVPDGEPGEICIQGRSVMLGYYKQPELTEDTFSGGWLRTGDVAVKDEQGFFTIVDRKKDMIVSGGFNVFPREIEDVLSTHPAVSSAAVIGVPDDKWGEAVKALVIAKPGMELDPRELIALVKEHKGPIYAPKSVELVDELPLTPVGKPDKKVLRKRYWEGEGRLVH
jgi:fatty-acyl-CoA synthase